MARANINPRVVYTGAVAATTQYSNSFSGTDFSGYASALIVPADSANVTITQQGSVDGSTFYDCYDSEGNLIGQVCSGLTSARLVRYEPVPAAFHRFKVVASVAGTLTLTNMPVDQH